MRNDTFYVQPANCTASTDNVVEVTHFVAMFAISAAANHETDYINLTRIDVRVALFDFSLRRNKTRFGDTFVRNYQFSINCCSHLNHFIYPYLPLRYKLVTPLKEW